LIAEFQSEDELEFVAEDHYPTVAFIIEIIDGIAVFFFRLALGTRPFIGRGISFIRKTHFALFIMIFVMVLVIRNMIAKIL
jgi:hypothetical protein